MNPKIKKVIDEIERTKVKILELQTLLPELERKRIDMENTEIIKLIRSAEILPAELPAFLESLKTPKAPAFVSAVQHGTPFVTVDGALDASDNDHEQDDDSGHDENDYPDGDNFNTDSQSGD